MRSRHQMQWEVYGWAAGVKRYCILAYCRTKAEALQRIERWTAAGMYSEMVVRKRNW